MEAVGVIEVAGVSGGLEITDRMVKSAPVSLISAMTTCPGKFIIVVGGEASAVQVAVEAGRRLLPELVIDDFVIGNLHAGVYPALTGTVDLSSARTGAAIGIIETLCIAAGIRAADTAAKTADVKLIDIRTGHGLGGRSHVIMTGEVGAVAEAVAAGARAARQLGMLGDRVVIPSADPKIWDEMLSLPALVPNDLQSRF